MNQPDFSKVFQPEQRLSPERDDIILRPYNIGELVLISGKLVACDPLVNPNSEPFAISLTPGRYPVILSVAHISRNNDSRVAYAMLRLSEKNAVRWEMALLPDEDLSSLSEGEVFGYGVDSGTGCFMDEEVGLMINESIFEVPYEETLTTKLEEALSKHDISTWCWANFCVNESNQANVIAFSSGWGDGTYATYFGYDEEGNIVNVVTDFEV